MARGAARRRGARHSHQTDGRAAAATLPPPRIERAPAPAKAAAAERGGGEGVRDRERARGGTGGPSGPGDVCLLQRLRNEGLGQLERHDGQVRIDLVEVRPQVQLDVEVGVGQRVGGGEGLGRPVLHVEEVVDSRCALEVLHRDGLLLLLCSTRCESLLLGERAAGDECAGVDELGFDDSLVRGSFFADPSLTPVPCICGISTASIST